MPVVFRWKIYRRCCSQVRAELELYLRSGCEGLLALTVTFVQDIYRGYCEQVMNLQGGRELRQLVIYPG